MTRNMAGCIIFEDGWMDISNYLQWKVRMSVVLKENNICNYVSYVVVAPTTDPVSLDLHEVNEAKSERIIQDGVKDFQPRKNKSIGKLAQGN
jgi:hypothetical protein